LRSRVAEEAPEGYLTMYQAMRRLGVSRQTVWQRVKRGEIEAIKMSGTDARKVCASSLIAHNPTSSTKPHKSASCSASKCPDLARNNAD
jgi:excisionase family DNA binding protein